jgi:UDP-N-acetylmuramate--alanine ligase
MAETAVPRIRADVLAGPVDLKRVHFVGIGGSGMLPVARVCAPSGATPCPVATSGTRPGWRL